LSNSLKQGWNRISRNYQLRMRIPTDDVYWGEFVVSERNLRILGNVKGKRVLEIGCGGAQNSIALAKRGARVCGVDLSQTQLHHGNLLARTDKVQIALIVADMQSLPFRDKAFDLVTTAVSLHYVSDLRAVVREAYRVLGKNGCFTFSAEHPMKEGKLVTTRGVSSVTVKDYFRRRVVRWVTQLPDGSTVRMHSYYRTLQDYFEALTGDGFVIERYLELERLNRKSLHAFDREDIQRDIDARRLYKFMKEVPYWFVVKARKNSHVPIAKRRNRRKKQWRGF
jgi:ubiquinone/menaquinone biosynthesis C-methylase UbiE